jgi:prepilin-type N-terminal cleavage/methylation domain-containing protein
MRRNQQSGMTVVELLVSMAVTSIILVGLTGVFFNVSSRYEGWAARLNTASTGPGLSAALQADSHRYVPCGDITDVQTFDLCPADSTDDPANDWVVRYVVSGGFPYVITREERGKPATFMVRSVNGTRPDFWADCFDGGATVAGHIHVYHLRIDDGSGGGTGNRAVDSENFSVYYVAPWRPNCQ